MNFAVRLRGFAMRGPAAWPRAIAHRLRSLQVRCAEHWRDWRDGVDTASQVEAGRIVTASPNKPHGIRYQASPAGAVRAVLEGLALPPGRVFADIGSGKGRVLLIARRMDFARVIGVEYSGPLCEVARRNLAVAERRGGPGAPVEIVCADAADYAFPHGEDVLYLFNPFDAVVLASMLDRLAASLQARPRRLWLVYHFPRWHETLSATGWLRLQAVHRFGPDEFAVFTHAPDEAVRPDPAARQSVHDAGGSARD